MHTFPKPNMSVRFSQRGVRILCREFHYLPVVYDVPGQQTSDFTAGKMYFSAQGYGPSSGRNINCFAGQEEYLVVSASTDHNLYVWRLPIGPLNDNQAAKQPLAVLRGHKDKIFSVRYNRRGENYQIVDAHSPMNHFKKNKIVYTSFNSFSSQVHEHSFFFLLSFAHYITFEKLSA